jgi:hypothetical protein
MGETPSHRHIADGPFGTSFSDLAQVAVSPPKPDFEQMCQRRHSQVRPERTLQRPHARVHGQRDVLGRNRFPGMLLTKIQRMLNYGWQFPLSH